MPAPLTPRSLLKSQSRKRRLRHHVECPPMADAVIETDVRIGNTKPLFTRAPPIGAAPAPRRGLQPGDAWGRRSGLDRHRGSRPIFSCKITERTRHFAEGFDPWPASQKGIIFATA